MSNFPIILFLLPLSFFLLLSSAFTPPSLYFINCGSNSNFTDEAGRSFTGDKNSGNFKISSQETIPTIDQNPSPNSPLFYQSARIFKKYSSYELKIASFGTHFLRFHFFTFQFPKSLSSPNFNISASGFSLVTNFTGNSNSNSALILEFILTINSSKLEIGFSPEKSHFAFVNAIEAFIVDLSPIEFIPNEALFIEKTGDVRNYTGILLQVLQKICRINVGGMTLTPRNDSLWRSWTPDGGFCPRQQTAITVKEGGRPRYRENVSKEIAPEPVYGTGRMVRKNSSIPSGNFNMTWSFNVTKNTKHFIRLHFCEIFSESPNSSIFNLYIGRKFSQIIDPYKSAGDIEIPFFSDYVFVSDSSGVLNISVEPISEPGFSNQIAFLNGLEILEMSSYSAWPVHTSGNQNNYTVFIVIGSVFGVLLIFVIALVLRRSKRNKKLLEASTWTRLRYPQGSSHGTTTSGSTACNLNLGLKISLGEILYATKNFNKKLLVGKGGFGNVYKGVLRNSMKVAVKRSEPGSGQGMDEFQTEIIVLSQIRHVHLVSLIGYCDECAEMILVYEFMENGTLTQHLYGSNFPPLPWKKRLEICIGAARGLHYLHKCSPGGIIHRDVKSNNILLDENLVAKVADFGISRPSTLDQAYVSTGVKGTFGYLDPEYIMFQQLTEKSDVYSFGVVLLEVLCARLPIDNSLPKQQVSLVEWGMSSIKKGMIQEIVDCSIKGEINLNSMQKFVETVEKCLQENSSDRPAMNDVLWDLEYALQLQKIEDSKEGNEYSIIAGSSALTLSNVGQFPSFNLSPDRDDRIDESALIVTESDVFSELRIDDAR